MASVKNQGKHSHTAAAFGSPMCSKVCKRTLYTVAMIDLPQLTSDIRPWALELGFAHAGIAQPALGADHQHLLDWLAKGQPGSMADMARNTPLTAEPKQQVSRTCRTICLRK